MIMSPKHLFPHFLQKYCFFRKKLLEEEILKTSFPIKKVIFIFVARRPLPFKRDLVPQNSFLPFSQKIQLFLKKPPCNKILCTSFVKKKVMLLISGATRLFSLKNRQMCPENSFLQVFRKILPFSKKLSSKKIFIISFRIVFIWCKMTPYRSQRLLCSEISLFYRTSCARDFCLQFANTTHTQTCSESRIVCSNCLISVSYFAHF